MPRFSIVAPNWNEMPYLRDWFLYSLSRQTFRDFEVIIVDGGSKDGSKEACLRDDLNITYVINDKRNIGYIRNYGEKFAIGDILLNTSTDVYFPPKLLEILDRYYWNHPEVVALAGRTFPHGSKVSLTAQLGYGAFDLIRWISSTRINPVRKLRPSGNFLTIYRSLFESLHGYPEVEINEDGLFGYKLDAFQEEQRGLRVVFNPSLYVIHHIKRFEKRGGIKTILFYLYVLGLMFPSLRRWLAPIERKSAKEFKDRSDLK